MKNIPYSEIKKIAVTKLLAASQTLLHPFSIVTLCRYPVSVTCDWHSNSTHFLSLILEGEMIYQEKGSPEQHFIAGDMVLLPALTTYRWKLIRPALTFQCSHFGFSFAEHSALFSLFGALQRKVGKVSLGLNAVEKVKTMLDSVGSTPPFRTADICFSTRSLRRCPCCVL